MVFLIAGGVSGAIYAIMASGLVLTYSTSGIFNFSHGAIAYVTALFFFELNSGEGWGKLPAAFVAIVVFAPALGYFLDKIMFRRLATAGEMPQIVATVGLSIALPALGIFLVERLTTAAHLHLLSPDNVLTVPGLGPTPTHSYRLGGGVAINTDQLTTLAAAIICAVALWLLVRHTRVGLRMRATVDRRSLAGLRKINPDRSSGLAWILGAGLAGLAGVLSAPLIGLAASNFTGLMLTCAAAAVFAGLRSIPLAFIAGVALGVVQDVAAGYLLPHVKIPGLADAIPFILLLLGLLVINRRAERSTGVATEEAPLAPADFGVPRWRRTAPWAVGAVGLVIYTFVFANSFWVGLIVSGMCAALILLSYVVITGTGGMVSLAQAAFVTSAAMMVGLLVAHHIPFAVGLLAGVAVSVLLGVIVALPALRLGGLYLALATLALGLICDDVIFDIGPLFNKNQGWNIPAPSIGPLRFTTRRTQALLLFILVGLAVAAVRNLQRSATGRAAYALRSAPTAAGSSGVSATRVRLILFAVSACLAGLGGVLYASFDGSIQPTNFPAEVSLLWLAIIVTLGIRRPGYAVVAGLVSTVFPYILTFWTTSTAIPQILFGLGGVALAKSPEGSIAHMKRAVRSLERRREQAGGGHPAPAGVGHPAPAGAGVAGAVPPSEVVRVAGRGAEAAPVLTLAGVTAGYHGVDVLHGISLELVPGQLLGVLGSNGAGKSTLCSVISGALATSGGRVLLGGEDATGRPSYWRSRHGILLAPEGRGIFGGLTVDENLRILLPPRDERELVYQRFPALSDRRSVHARLLSGGEQQILALAPLLVHRPRVLIADEPYLGLAPQIVKQVMTVLGELRDDGVAVILVDEKSRDVLPIADKIAVLQLGRVVWSGDPDGIEAQELAAAYLGAGQPAADGSHRTRVPVAGRAADIGPSSGPPL